MAIQPIDLQIMYSQMSNVANIAAHQQNGAQLADAMQQTKIVQQNIEQTSSVQKTAENESKSVEINPDGHQSSERFSAKKKKQESAAEPEKKKNEIRESYLGQHIDITR